MAEPETTRKEPYAVEVEAGRSCLWCRCGRSDHQSYCDCSRDGAKFTQVRCESVGAGTA